MNTQDLIQHFGTQTAIAKAIGIEIPSVCHWFKTGRIPAIRQLELEEKTQGKLRADAGISRGWKARK